VTVSPSAMEASSVGAARLALARLGFLTRPPGEAGRNVEPRVEARAAYAEAGRRQGWLYTTLIEGSSIWQRQPEG
jgi:hypothetical protein